MRKKKRWRWMRVTESNRWSNRWQQDAEMFVYLLRELKQKWWIKFIWDAPRKDLREDKDNDQLYFSDLKMQENLRYPEILPSVNIIHVSFRWKTPFLLAFFKIYWCTKQLIQIYMWYYYIYKSQPQILKKMIICI